MSPRRNWREDRTSRSPACSLARHTHGHPYVRPLRCLADSHLPAVRGTLQRELLSETMFGRRGRGRQGVAGSRAGSTGGATERGAALATPDAARAAPVPIAVPPAHLAGHKIPEQLFELVTRGHTFSLPRCVPVNAARIPASSGGIGTCGPPGRSSLPSTPSAIPREVSR